MSFLAGFLGLGRPAAFAFLPSRLQPLEVLRSALGDLPPTLPSKTDGGGILLLFQNSEAETLARNSMHDECRAANASTLLLAERQFPWQRSAIRNSSHCVVTITSKQRHRRHSIAYFLVLCPLSGPPTNAEAPWGNLDVVGISRLLLSMAGFTSSAVRPRGLRVTRGPAGNSFGVLWRRAKRAGALGSRP